MSVNLIKTVESFGIPEDQEQKERFKIETKDQAAWALRKMSRIQAEIEEKQQGSTGRGRKDHRLAQRGEREAAASISFFESLLHEYFMQLRGG